MLLLLSLVCRCARVVCLSIVVRRADTLLETIKPERAAKQSAGKPLGRKPQAREWPFGRLVES